MNKIAISSVFVLTVLVAGMAVVPSAFADHPKATVSLPKGSGVPGCEVDDKCYIPSVVTVDVGGEVHWSNDDSAAHTVTSGTPENGPDGVFDSSLFMAGNSFTHKFTTEGTFDYFCMVHPWMVGQVIVQAAGEEMEEEHGEEMEHMEGTVVEGMSSDGSIKVKITATDPMAGERMTINVEFIGADGKHVEHVNHDISATQGGTNVLDDKAAHHHEGKGTHTTAPLASADPVDIKVTLQGLGVNPPFTGPMGEVVTFQVVPEFGTIAMMILGVAIVSIVALSARSKIMPRI
jgi:predicted secreted protein with PEFG-CTERM motif